MVNQIIVDSSRIDVPCWYDFTIQLNQKIKIKNYIRLIQAVIPFDSYLIDSTNNTFQVNAKTYSIPIGNYDILSLSSQMKSLVTPDISSFTIQFSNLTYRVTFSASTNFTMQINQQLADILGFQSLQFTSNNSYTTTKTPIINSPQVILINIKEIPDSSIVQSYKYETDFSFMILNTANKGLNILYQNQNDENTIEMNGEIRQISVQLYQNNGQFFKINSGIQLLFEFD